MPRPPFALAFALLALPAFGAEPPAPAPSPMPEEVSASIASYKGKCPCPYTLKENGKPCGGNSGYSRAGGQDVVCYLEDLATLVEEN